MFDYKRGVIARKVCNVEGGKASRYRFAKCARAESQAYECVRLLERLQCPKLKFGKTAFYFADEKKINKRVKNSDKSCGDLEGCPTDATTHPDGLLEMLEKVLQALREEHGPLHKQVGNAYVPA